MKKFTKFVPLVAMAMMVGSCAEKIDSSANNNGTNESTDGAYVSLKIVSRSSARADGYQEGTKEESAVNSVKLLVFDRDYDYIGLSKSETPESPNVYKFEVAPDAFRFFAIVNSTPEMDVAIANVSGNWGSVEPALQTIMKLSSQTDITNYTTGGAFPMVNAGSHDGTEEIPLATPLDANLTDGKISTVDSLPTPLSIKVDRMVAKFTAEVSDNLKVTDSRTEDGVEQSPAPVGKVEGVRLNVVNKKTFIYSHINQVNDYGDDYRTDPNMTVGPAEALPPGQETELTENFFWLHNYEDTKFNAPGAENSEYVLENTANGDFFDYNNLTQLVVKATYIPTGQPDPDDLPGDFTTALDHKDVDKGSWFLISVAKFGKMQMTFKGVKDYYGAIKVGVDGSYAQDTETCDKMDRQLRHMLAKATELNGITEADLATITWADDRVTCAVLNSIPKGGYVAATVPNEEDYVVQYFQFGLNYYDIFIQHDKEQGIGHLGRWGMVRNNHYTLTVNSISGPGLPYIPDPTDPEIKDPQNPNPKDPDPADEDMAYIEATIKVNDWTLWTQGVDLN